MAELQATLPGKLNFRNIYFLNQKKKKEVSAKTYWDPGGQKQPLNCHWLIAQTCFTFKKFYNKVWLYKTLYML